MCDFQNQEDRIQEQLDAIRNAYKSIIANDKDKIVGWRVNGSDKVFPLDWDAQRDFLIPIIGFNSSARKENQQIKEVREIDGDFNTVDTKSRPVISFKDVDENATASAQAFHFIANGAATSDNQNCDTTYCDPNNCGVNGYEQFIRDIEDSSAAQHQSNDLEPADDGLLQDDQDNTNDEYPYMKTVEEFRDAFLSAREIFVDKLTDYGPSWRILRPMSVTDQLANKAERIRNIDETGISAVGEGIYPEFQALVNYGIVALIQLELGPSLTIDMTADEALKLFDKKMNESFDLMCKKNEDYNEAWRRMRVCSYTDFILVKLSRIKQIEENRGQTIVSEGIDSNYMDIINYAVFALIKLNEKENKG